MVFHTVKKNILVMHADRTHPLLQNMPVSVYRLWFKRYLCIENGDRLFLAMERIMKNPLQKDSQFADLLTLEIVSLEELTEWKEFYPDQSFVMQEPFYLFHEHDNHFTLGTFDQSSLYFQPEVKTVLIPEKDQFILDLEGDKSIWKPELINR